MDYEIEYLKKVDGAKDVIALIVPYGWEPGIKERGGPVAVYKECIEKNVTWEKLIGYNPPPADVII